MTVFFGAFCVALFAIELSDLTSKREMMPPISYRVNIDALHDNQSLTLVEAGINELGFVTEQPLKPEIGRFVAVWRHQPGIRKKPIEKSLAFGQCSKATIQEANDLGYVQCLQGLQSNELFLQGASNLKSIANAHLHIEI